MTLNQMKPGQTARILSVGGEGSLRNRLIDMGIIPRTTLTLRKVAPMGDPLEIRVRGYELTLRLEDAANITIELLSELWEDRAVQRTNGNALPCWQFSRRDSGAEKR